MTTFAIPRPASVGTDEVNETIVATVEALLSDAGSDGAPLSAVMQALVDRGVEIPTISTSIMQLIRERRVDLTEDRRLRWSASADAR